jgi:hypothetical protein
MDAFNNSSIPCVVEFRNDPCKASYIEKIYVPHISGRREEDLREDPISMRNEKKRIEYIDFEATEVVEKMHIIDMLHKKSKYSRNTAREFILA